MTIKRGLSPIFLEDLLTKAKALGEKLHATLKGFQDKHAFIGDVRGLGPMIAMELVSDRKAKTPAAEKGKQLVQFCMDRNLIILAAAL